jgi:hypothetical protein
MRGIDREQNVRTNGGRMMMMMTMMMVVVSQLVVINYSRKVVGNEAELRGVGKNACICICTTETGRGQSVQVQTKDGGSQRTQSNNTYKQQGRDKIKTDTHTNFYFAVSFRLLISIGR